MSYTNNRATIPASHYTLAQNMNAFDKLPKAVRQALRDSDLNWSAASILYGMRKHKLRSAAVVALIAKRDGDDRQQFAEHGGWQMNAA